MNDIPIWPAKLTREQQKVARKRGKDFDAALKRGAKAAGWRFAGGQVFQQSGEWFISILTTLLWERGVWASIMIKPMALDALFWDIVGLSENESLPLSFRANGAWVLRTRVVEDYTALDVTEVDQLAAHVFEWGNRRASDILSIISVKMMLRELSLEMPVRGQSRALAICLTILAGDLEEAMQLCRLDDPDTHPQVGDLGGFNTINPDGSCSTFLDQARDWIARKRRDELTVV
jgi:hypothetical protein